jgi:hypothetical protein
MQHKWHKEIKAWADGAEIEYKNNSRKMCWTKCESSVFDTEAGYEYRIKPQPKEPQYLYAFIDASANTFLRMHTGKNKSDTYIGKIKLEVDDD